MRHGPSKTVSAQFQTSLISLVERLEQTNPFFVRCIKSNGEKVRMYMCVYVHACIHSAHVMYIAVLEDLGLLWVEVKFAHVM